MNGNGQNVNPRITVENRAFSNTVPTCFKEGILFGMDTQTSWEGYAYLVRSIASRTFEI